LFVDIHQLIAAKYPELTLESPVQGWVFLREFERGIESYEELEEKTGLDDRWAGICYFQIHEDMRSVELFYRAIARGVDAARINLAHALGYIERGDEVIPELLKVNRETLSTYDKVLFYRVKSLHEETSGDLSTALSDAQTAWELVKGTPQFSVLAPDILSQLAVLHGRVGRAQTALSFIERNLSISTGVDALRAQIHRAHILITLGRFSSAIADLETVNLSKAPRYLHSIVDVHLAEAEWALGNLDRSLQRFESAVELATALNIGYEEFLARVGLALLLGVKGELDPAFEHLSYAERLVSDRSDRLYFRFREILLNRLAGALGGTEAIIELRTVADEMGKMGALQEQGWVRLHIAHEMWQLCNQEFESELLEVRRLSILLQNPAFLSRELALLPEFAPLVTSQLDTAASKRILTLHTLGEESISLDGVQIRLALRRGVELLSYFLDKDEISLETLLSDLFPRVKARTAKSYFHQFRYQLSRHVRGVQILYSPKSRGYRLDGQHVKIIWDVEALRAGDESLRGRTFLPTASSAWARGFDRELNGGNGTLLSVIGEADSR
jgi:tetratricopeptide (TPR) repeat protein